MSWPSRTALTVRKKHIKEPDTGEPTAHALAHYRCFLPDLAGFTGLHRAGPGI